MSSKVVKRVRFGGPTITDPPEEQVVSVRSRHIKEEEEEEEEDIKSSCCHLKQMKHAR